MKLFTLRSIELSNVELRGLMKDLHRTYGEDKVKIGHLYNVLNDAVGDTIGCIDSLKIKITDAARRTGLYEIVINSLFGYVDMVRAFRDDGLNKSMCFNELFNYLYIDAVPDHLKNIESFFSEDLIKNLTETSIMYGDNATVRQFNKTVMENADIRSGSIKFEHPIYTVTSCCNFGVDHFVISTNDGFKGKNTFKGLLAMTKRFS